MSFNALNQLVLSFFLIFSIFIGLSPGYKGSHLIGYAAIFYISFLLLSSTLQLRKTQPLLVYFIFLSIMWCVIRIAYLQFSVDSLNYTYLVNLSPNEVARSIILLTISSLFFISGLLLGDKKNITKKNLNIPFLSSGVRAEFLSKYFALVLLYELFSYFLVWAGFATKSTSIITFFLSSSFALILFASFFFYNLNSISKNQKILFVLLIISFIFLNTLAGSKAGIFHVFIAFVVVLLATNYKAKISLKFICLGITLLPVALLFFIIGDEMRVIRYALFNAGEFDLINLVTIFNDSFVTRLSESDFKMFLDSVSRRLSMFDYLNVFYNHNPINEYLGINYGLKTFWNVIYPNIYSGLTFSDASIFQSNLFKVSYGHGTYEEAVLNYHSDMLPLFGTLYINFGSISFLILSIIGFIFSFTYKLIDNFISNASYLYKSLFLLIYGDILFGLGLVSSFQQILFFTLIPLITYFILQNVRFKKLII